MTVSLFAAIPVVFSYFAFSLLELLQCQVRAWHWTNGGMAALVLACFSPCVLCRVCVRGVFVNLPPLPSALLAGNAAPTE